MIWSDINLGFFKQNQEILYDEDCLRQQFLLMFTTDRGTRVKRRQFSSGLQEKLFEPCDTVTAEEIRQELLSITSRDSRIQVRMSEVVPDVQNQLFYIHLDMYCPALGKEFDLIFNLKSKN